MPVTVSGRPTVRRAQLPGGNRKAQEANAGGRKATGNRDVMIVPDNRPDTGDCPDPKGCRRGPGEPVKY